MESFGHTLNSTDSPIDMEIRGLDTSKEWNNIFKIQQHRQNNSSRESMT